MTEHFYLRFHLKPGMCGEDVRYLQEALKASGFQGVPADGVFGAETTSAARELQIRQRVDMFDLLTEPMRPLPNTSLHGGGDLSARLNSDDPRVKAPFADSPEVFESKDAYERFLRSDPSPILDEDVVDWGYLARHMEVKGIDPPQGGPWPKSEDWRFENTHIPPPGSPYCAVADAGGSTGSAIGAIGDIALYDIIRHQLPPDIGDERAAEATLRAMQDGIKSPEQLEQVVVANDRIFAVGTTPGVRGVVDLNLPAPSMAEMATQFAALDNAPQLASAPQHDARAFARV